MLCASVAVPASSGVHMTDTNPPLWALSTADPDVCGECAGVVAPAAPAESSPAEEGEKPPAPPWPEPL